MKRKKEQVGLDSADWIIEREIQIQSKMGRPRLPEGEKREKNRITVYVNDAEIEEIRQSAEEAGTSISDYARQKLFQ